jgi:UDP-GlcNAc:undecaprenyl-phosphate/decaprenyl-phosphate GlcNAc-1-phosphate transferase
MKSLDTWDAILAFVFAASVAWMLVPAAESIARRIGAIDEPKERGLHDVPTPKLGGLAIGVAVLAAGAIFLPWDAETRSILGGAAVITAVGVVDDIFELGAFPKLVGQIGAALIPVVFGDVRVDVTTIPFVGGYELGWVSYPLTIFGFVAVINIINFIDGVDGLASGVCAISAGAFAVIAISLDRFEAGVLAAITAGGALGFLRHGFPPASSFMGDTGSNLLGYLLAAVAVQGSLKTNAALALALPLLVLAIPILDTSFVVAKRLKYRTPIYQADRWHFHHRMANIGFQPRQTLLYLYGWTLALAVLALGLRFIPYSDDRGNFDLFWTAVITVLLLGALFASVYVIYTLEILKLKRVRLGQRLGLRGSGVPQPVEEEVEADVKRELESGEDGAPEPEVSEDPPSEPPAPVPDTDGSSQSPPARRERERPPSS